MFGAFALGNAAPNLENVGNARGAAFIIWHIIDRVIVISFVGQFLDKIDF